MTIETPVTANPTLGSDLETTDAPLVLPQGASAQSLKVSNEGMTTTSRMRVYKAFELGVTNGYGPEIPPFVGTNEFTQTIIDQTITTSNCFELNKPLTVKIGPDGSTGQTEVFVYISSIVRESPIVVTYNVETLTQYQSLSSVQIIDTLVGDVPFVTPADTTFYYQSDHQIPDHIGYCYLNNPPTEQYSPDDGQLTVRIVVDFQPGKVNKSTIILAKDTPVPGDHIIKDCSGHYIKFSEFDCELIYESNGILYFAKPYTIPCGAVICNSFQTWNVTFGPESCIRDITLSYTLIDPTYEKTGPAQYYTLPPGVNITNYLIDINFPAGMLFKQSLIIPPGSVSHGFIEFPKDTTFGPTEHEPIVLENVLLDPGFVLPAPGTELNGIVPTANKITVYTNDRLEETSNMPFGASTKCGLKFARGTVFQDGYVADGDIIIDNKGLQIDSEIKMAPGSVIFKNTKLAKGLFSFQGMKVQKEVRVPAGTLFPKGFTLKEQITVPAHVGSGVEKLYTGMTFPAYTCFQAGFHFPSGLAIPETLKIVISAVDPVVLKSGMELKRGTTFGRYFRLWSNTVFGSSYEFIPGYAFPANTTFPAKTKFEKGNLLPFPFKVPSKHRFVKGCDLPAGTQFAAGSRLPSHIDPYASARNVSAETAANPFDIVTLNDQDYIMISSGSVLVSHLKLPAGTILSSQVGGTTTSSNYNTGSTAVSIHLDTSDYNIITPSGPLEPLVIPSATEDSVIPTPYEIKLLRDTELPVDILIPYNRNCNRNILHYVVFPTNVTLGQFMTLCEDYCTDCKHQLIWPAFKELPGTWHLENDVTLEGPENFHNTARITLPRDEPGYILLSTIGSAIITPDLQVTINQSIILGMNTVISNSDLNTSTKASHAFIELVAGTVLSLPEGTSIKTPRAIILSKPFTLTVDICTYPKLTLLPGTYFPAGSYSLGEMVFNGHDGLPAGIPLPEEFVISENFDVTEENEDVILPAGTFLSAKSKIAKGSIFPLGLTLNESVSMGPFKGISQIITLPANMVFNHELRYPQFLNISPLHVTYDHTEIVKQCELLHSIITVMQAEKDVQSKKEEKCNLYTGHI